MDQELETMIYEGLVVDIAFGELRPTFGDLFPLCGDVHPHFPPTNHFAFADLADLQFDQVDDYFGVPSLSEDGDDVVVWLYPLVDGEPVEHHPGPFDAVRISFSVLRNPSRHADFYLQCVERFAAVGTSVYYRSRDRVLQLPTDLNVVREDVRSITQYWQGKGIVVGSEASLMVDF